MGQVVNLMGHVGNYISEVFPPEMLGEKGLVVLRDHHVAC